MIDTHSVGDMIGAVPEERETRRASRYDAIIATLVGLCALCVSAYTAYVQRQQVRAAVWPILEFDSSNGPIRFTLANKGVGPAIIKHVILKVDNQPVKNWIEVLDKLMGSEKHRYSESDMSGHVLAANESRTVFTPQDANGNDIAYDRSNPLWIQMNRDRLRVSVEICYWTLRASGLTPSTTTETRRCPTPSDITFQQ